MTRTTYIIYDERAALGVTAGAEVLETCETMREAKETVQLYYPMGVIYEYEVGKDGKLRNERMVK